MASSSYERIYAVVRRIPRGRVATYGQVATLAGLAGQPRLVGYAMRALPPGSVVPWHRVINARGEISPRRADAAGGLAQRLRLEAEGVRFDARGRVTFERYGWARGRGAHGSASGERKAEAAGRRRDAR